MYAGAWIETEEECPECSSPDTVENANTGLLYCEECEGEVMVSDADRAPREFLIFSSLA